MSLLSGRTRRWAGPGVVAAVGVTAAVFAGPALAAAGGHEHALQASINDPAPVSPGATGELVYTVTNVGHRTTDGILLNVSLPPHVRLNKDPHCQRTGRNDEGGDLVSCNFSDAQGLLVPGQTRLSRTPFHVDRDAPAPHELGRLGALAVPLRNGRPTEDFRDLSGRNTVWTSISTGPAEHEGGGHRTGSGN